MLGWLLNLGFAGGGGVVSLQEFVPFVVLIKKTPVETVVVKRTVSHDVER